jgi:hypothetical protein
MNEEKYCVYAKWGGLFGLFFPWVLIGISDENVGFDAGYGPDAYYMGYKLMLVKMEIPLVREFFFVPKKAKVIGPVIQRSQ